MSVLSKLRSALKLMALLLGVVAIWELWAPIAYFVAPAVGLSDNPLRAEGQVVSSISARVNPDDLTRERRLLGGYLGADVVVAFTDRNGEARTTSARTLFFPPQSGQAVDVYYFVSELLDADAQDAGAPRDARALINLPGLLYGRAAMYGALALVLTILYRGFGYFGRRMAESGVLARVAPMPAMSDNFDKNSKVRIVENTGSDTAALLDAVRANLRDAPVALVLKIATIACFFFAGLWALGAGLSLWQLIDPSFDFSGSFWGSAIACVLFATAGWYLRKLTARLPGGAD